MLMSMDLRDLRSFLAVVRAGSFTTAAAELGYTQSAVSQHVAALEADVGAVLLHRRPVRTTTAGQRLAEHAARIVLRLDVARSELAHVATDPVLLRVAASPLASPRLLAGALRDVRADAPGLQVTVTAVRADQAVVHVADGRADLALVDGVTAPDNPLALADAGLLRAVWIDQEPLAVVLPTDHPLARRGQVDLATVVDAPWIDAPMLSGGVQAIAGAASGLTTRPIATPLRYDGADVATLLALVAAGHGLTVLPRSAVAGLAGVTAVPLGSPTVVHRTELLTLRTAGGATHRLADALLARADRGDRRERPA